MLKALIFADAPSEDGPELSATLDVAGTRILAHQVRQLTALGAAEIFVEVGRVTPALTQIFDDLRSGPVAIIPMRHHDDLADRIGADDTLILVANGLFAPATFYHGVASGDAPVVLVTGATPDTAAFERIEGEWRWAGLARLTQHQIVDTIGMPDDWHIGLTLLRAAIQSGARRQTVDAASFGDGTVAMILSAQEAARAEDRLFGSVRVASPGLWGALTGPVAGRVFGPAAMARRISPLLFAGAGLVTAAAPLSLLAAPQWVHSPAILAGLAGVALISALLGDIDRYLGHFAAARWRAPLLAAQQGMRAAFLPLLLAVQIWQSGTTPFAVQGAMIAALLLLLWAAHAVKRTSYRAQTRPADVLLAFLALLGAGFTPALAGGYALGATAIVEGAGRLWRAWRTK